MVSNTSNKVIVIEYFKHEGYHNVKCISKKLGYRNNRSTRRRGCIPEFLLEREYVSLERCEAPQRSISTPQRLTLFSDEPHHKGLVHFPLSVFLRGGIRSLSTTIRGTTHKGIGGSRTAFNNNPRHNPQRDWGLPNGFK